MTNKTARTTRGYLPRKAWFGFFCGAIFPVAFFSPVLIERVQYSMRGGGGESADWGGPFAYMMFFGLPAGLLGAALAVILAKCAIKFRR